MRAIAILAFATSLLATVNCQQSGAIRLYNYGYDTSLTSGIVEVYYSGQWNTICRYNSFGSSTWGAYEATVACQQLGYTGAISYSHSGDSDYGTDTTPLDLYGVSCSSSSYLVLLQCFFYSGSVDVCSSYDQVAVSCYSSLLTSSPYTGMVRLQGGADVTTGRAEVYCNGQWGTLCNSTFSSSVALTVCYQLGYNDYVSYKSGTNPGSSSDPIWLSNYNCYSGYSCISYCQSCPSVSSTSCQHSQDVSISCQYNTDNFNLGSSRYSCNYYLSTGAIVGIVIGAIALFAICLCLWIGIPVCICCCLGVGIGSAAGRYHRHYDHV